MQAAAGIRTARGGTNAVRGFFPGTEMPDPGWWRALWPAPERVLRTAGLAPGMDAVDLCSGDGWFTLPMARLARRVHAIDIDGGLLAAARKRLDAAGIRNAEFIEGDAYDIAQLVPRPVDLVFLANAFHGVPEPARLARAVARVLKPGGRFVVVNWQRRPREETKVLGEPRGPASELRMTPEATAAAVAPSGLMPGPVVDVPPYHYAASFAKARRPRSPAD